MTTNGRIFTCTLQGLSLGQHTIWAVATDNGGRSNESTAYTITVNGEANVTVGVPRPGALIEPDSNITLSADASDPLAKFRKWNSSQTID
jgi:hypothetical protein